MKSKVAPINDNGNNGTFTIDIQPTKETNKKDDQVSPNQIITIKPDISLWQAIETGQLNVLAHHLQHDPTQIDARDPQNDCTLLYHTVLHHPNPTGLLDFLLQQGADVTSHNLYNVQVIHAVLLQCPQPLQPLELLLAHGADPNARDGDGWTALHYAARFCPDPLSILQVLMKAGGQIDWIDVNHKTCLFPLLANGDHSQALDWLIRVAKANVRLKGDCRDHQSKRFRKATVFLQAAKYGRLGCLKVLCTWVVEHPTFFQEIQLDEFVSCLDLIRQRLSRMDENQEIEKLGIMILIFENMIQKSLEHQKTKSLKTNNIFRRIWK